MSRSLIPLGRCVLALVGATLACSIPTAMCACPPSRSVVFVRGTLTDASGTAIVGARLYFDGVPTTLSPLPLHVSGAGDALTDAGGAFRGPAYSDFSPGPLVLRAAVVRPGLPDTVRLGAGNASFRSDRERPDTVLVSLRLP